MVKEKIGLEKMKLKDFGKVFKNSRNNQVSFVLKARKLKKFGLTNEQLMNIRIAPKETKLFAFDKEKKI